MATYALTNCKLYVAQYDLSGYTNALELRHESEPLETTTFGSTHRTRVSGLADISYTQNGFSDFADDAQDEIINSLIGTPNTVTTICPTDGTDGERAFLFRAGEGDYSSGGSVGEVHAFTVSGSGTDKLVYGTVLHPATARTSTQTGTGRLLGAVSASQTLYAGLHVIAASGTNPTLDVTIESDDASGFVSPATRITFAQATGKTSEWKTAAGAITDTYYRAKLTIGGTSPSFTAVVVVGIK